MCGRFSLATDVQVLVDLLQVERVLAAPAELRPRYNIAPSQLIPIVRHGDCGRELVLARWGLVPHWSKDPKPKYSTINARAETVADKPTYRGAFRHRRCLIPATGFYEWKGTGAAKQPYHIRLPSGAVMAFAGLWERWEGAGEAFESCSIIVTAASPALRQLHDRMPVILQPAHYDTWLDNARFDGARLQALLMPSGADLAIFAVDRRVNRPANDDPSLIEERPG